MRVILFGATGMIGRGVLFECLRDTRITQVTVVGRRSVGLSHPKLRDVIAAEAFINPTSWEPVLSMLGPHEACFYCLGVSAAGLGEQEYARVTYDLTVSLAAAFVRQNPAMVFVYISGQGTDSSGKGRAMWARVKGRTENALLRLPFKAAYMFRIGAVVPVDGERSSTGWYNWVYTLAAPLMPILQRAFPDYIVTSAEVGRAMITSAYADRPSGILESRDIVALARGGSRG